MYMNYLPTDGMRNNRIETERIKVLKVVAEAIGQLVIDNVTCINAIKIDRISAHLVDSSDHLFENKVVKQGTIRKEIFYVDPTNRLRYKAEDVPFMLTVELPGFKPSAFTEVQNHLLAIDVDYSLTPANQCIPGCLRQKIVADILVKASEWTQLDVVTRVDIFPKVSVGTSGCVYRCKCC